MELAQYLRIFFQNSDTLNFIVNENEALVIIFSKSYIDRQTDR